MTCCVLYSPWFEPQWRQEIWSLDRMAGSDSEVCCKYTEVKEFDSWEGHENCHKYCVEICSVVHLPRMFWIGLRNMSGGVEVAES